MNSVPLRTKTYCSLPRITNVRYVMSPECDMNSSKDRLGNDSLVPRQNLVLRQSMRQSIQSTSDLIRLMIWSLVIWLINFYITSNLCYVSLSLASDLKLTLFRAATLQIG